MKKIYFALMCFAGLALAACGGGKSGGSGSGSESSSNASGLEDAKWPAAVYGKYGITELPTKGKIVYTDFSGEKDSYMYRIAYKGVTREELLAWVNSLKEKGFRLEERDEERLNKKGYDYDVMVYQPEEGKDMRMRISFDFNNDMEFDYWTDDPNPAFTFEQGGAEGEEHPIVKYNLEPEVFSFRNLAMIEDAVANSGNSTPIGVHVKLDTGMHRLGFAEADIPELINRIQANPLIHIKSIFSHLATADNADEDEFTMSQINCFERVSSMIVEAFPYKILRHILNTAGITRYNKYQFDMVRLGIGLYGVPVCPEDAPHLKAVTALRTTISQIKDIPEGDSIGYNRHGRATRPMRIGIIPIGYADGIPRLLGNGNASFFINGQPVKIVGDVCMDMCMLDLSNIEANEGDVVTIFDDEHSVSDLAKCCGTIPYELMTRVSQRVKRVYFQE